MMHSYPFFRGKEKMFLFFSAKEKWGDESLALVTASFFSCQVICRFFSADGQIKFGASREDLARFCKRGKPISPSLHFLSQRIPHSKGGESELNEAAKKGKGSLLNLSFRQKISTYVHSFFPQHNGTPTVALFVLRRQNDARLLISPSHLGEVAAKGPSFVTAKQKTRTGCSFSTTKSGEKAP